MASPQPDKFIRIANELWDEVIRRDFSKRQKDIINFLWRLSYGCRKKYAYIPKMKDFELCGVPATQLKKELEYLEQCRVLIWFREESIYAINKDYDQWQVSPVRSWNEDRFKELIAINLHASKTSQNVKENFMNHEDFGDFDDLEEDENFIKREETTSQNMKSNFTKHEVEEGQIPRGSRAEAVPKDKKDNIKDINTAVEVLNQNQDTETPAAGAAEDFSFGRIYKIFEEHFTENGKIGPLEAEDLSDQYETYGGEWLLEAMREAVRHGKRNLAYINAILNGFRERGGPHKERASPGGHPVAGPPFLDENDPITRMMLEEERRQRGTAQPV